MILEILISTMNRDNLSFLNDMFDNNYSHLQILIINQTSQDKILKSDKKNIRVINSFEFGLSKSRNLALKNAVGDICLFADDDVKYIQNFDKIIKQAFLKEPKASIVKFKIDTFCGKAYKKYPDNSKSLTSNKDIFSASSVEIAFKRIDILENNMFFNTFFGLGSYFDSGEEYLFLKKALNLGLNINFENEYILKHSFKRSTSNMASDKFVKAQAALYFHDYKNLSYLFLLKFILFLLRKRLIRINEVFEKTKVGIVAINEYKKLNKI